MNGVLDPILSVFLPSKDLTKEALPLIKESILDCKKYSLFPDTLPTLEKLTAKGWEHVVLSNNHPDVLHLVKGLGIEDHFSLVFTSACIGFEKPKKECFDYVLQRLKNRSKVWMIGDNETADAFGAEAAGISAILVRKPPKTFYRYAKDLTEVERLLE
jgi:putative hydrolase of the HAD superfamily